MARAKRTDRAEARRRHRALDAGVRNMLGVHWGTFDLTDEPLDEPPRRFHQAARAQQIAEERVWTPPVGETRQW